MFDALNERRLAAIILGDVVGYSRLMGIDEVGTMTALKAHRNELILPALAAYRGRMVGSPGDAMLMEFGSAVDAVSCAVAVQRKMIARNVEVPEERRIRFRLGINLGDIVIDGEEIYGDGVNVAARLESLCEPGGLCLSRSIEEQVRQKLTLPFTDGGEQQLKNISHPMRIFRLSAEFIGTLPETALPVARKKSTQARVAPGSTLNNTYKIDELIGSGGMGEIFKGHEIHSGGLVAVKVIRPDMMENDTALALFQREALVLKDIHHDAIVRYYIFSFDPDSKRHYLTMEFVDGVALSNLVKRGPLAFEAVSALCRRVASGLQVAHERGIVHRDVSPDNIIAPNGDVSRAKIIDFGIARATDIGAGTIIGGGFAGKYNYVSPEQLGLAGSEVTPQSDIYSFGLVLAEASLGQPLDMGGTQAEVIDKRRVVPDLKDLDHRLRPLIERMLQPDPANRPASMAEVAAWSGDAVPAVTTTPTGPERRPRPVMAPSPARNAAKPARRIERWIMGGALMTVLVLGAGLASYETWFATPPVRRPTGPIYTPPLNNTPPPNNTPAATETPPGGDTPSIGGSLDSPPNGPPAGPPATGSQAGPPIVPPAPPAPPTTPPASTDEPTPPEEPPPNSPGDATGNKPPLTPPVTPMSVDRIAGYIKSYQAGGCLFAQPGRITASSAAIDGFAQSKADIEGLDHGFTQTIGFQPDITAVRIVPRQCPALDFMRRVKTDDTAPALILTSDRVSHDQALAGEVQVKAEHSIALLQVRDDGTVVNMSKALKPDGNAQTFELRALRASGAGSAPQLLIAVASPHPLDTLNKGGDRKAEEVFRAILDEAGKKGDTVSANVKAFLAGG